MMNYGKNRKNWGSLHQWIVGVCGIALAVIIYIFFSSFKPLSGIAFVIALTHILPVIILLLSIRFLIPNRIKRYFSEKRRKIYEKKIDFGWSFWWMNGYWMIGSIFLALAVAIYIIYPAYNLVAFLFFLISANFYLGNIVLRESKKEEFMTLPFVDLFSSDSDLILDAGCGSGRTTLAVSKIMRNSRIVALDRFDSDYIEEGGMELFRHNITLAGITDKVQIEKGDVTQMPFEKEKFDSCVSTYMIDHLGNKILTGLKEINRVLKIKGRFLLIVIVPNYASFALANILSFMFTSVKKWKEMFILANFKLLDGGEINGGRYFLLEKEEIR